MNILLVIGKFEVGGIISVVDNLSKELIKKGHKVIIFGAEDRRKEFPFKEMFNGSKVKKASFPILTKKRWLEDLSLILRSFWVFRRLIGKQKIDLIAFNHSHSALGIMLSRSSWNIPKVFHFHGAWDIEERNTIKNDLSLFKRLKINTRLFFYKKAEGFVLRKSSLIIVLSQKSKELLLSHFKHLGCKRIEIIPSGIEIKKSKSFVSKEDLCFSSKVPLIFSLGRFDKKKGLDYLLKAASILNKKNIDFKMVIAGPVSDWQYCNDLFSLYEDLRLEGKVHFLHKLSFQEKERFFKVSDFLVVPSTGFEAYPVTIMEALFYGLPVIATRVGGIPDMLLDLDKRFLVTPKNSLALAEKIEWFLDLSKKERKKISEKCINYAQKNFSLKKSCHDVLSIYNSVVE